MSKKPASSFPALFKEHVKSDEKQFASIAVLLQEIRDEIKGMRNDSNKDKVEAARIEERLNGHLKHHNQSRILFGVGITVLTLLIDGIALIILFKTIGG